MSSSQKPIKSYINCSYLGLFTCLATLMLAFLFKEYLINLLIYLEEKSTSNVVEFHLILILLFVLMSLPVLSPYLICILIPSYVYGFTHGLPIVIIYTVIGMTISFACCRYMFYDYAHAKVKNLVYLQVICSLIISNEKGYKIIFLSRLMPIPFGLANLAFAITSVNFRTYILSSIIGLLPSQLILCYIGSTLKSMSEILIDESPTRTASLVFMLQLIIACFVMYYILTAAKIELQKHIYGQKNLDNTSTSNYPSVDVKTNLESDLNSNQLMTV